MFITVRISSLADGSGATGVQWIEKVNDALTFWYAVEGTLIVSDSMSASWGAVSQSLVGFAPGGITPDQVTVRVCPVDVGTVTDWPSGVAARAPVAGTANAPSATAAVRTT